MGLFDRGNSNDELLVVTELLENGEGNSVTKKNLTGREVGGESLLSYIRNGEQPHYILNNRNKGLTYNERGTKDTTQPSSSGWAFCLFTDQRVLFIIDTDSGIDQRSIEYDDVESVEASTGFLKNQITIKTLYANYRFYVSGSISSDEFENSIAFVRRQAGLEKPAVMNTPTTTPTQSTTPSLSEDRDKQTVLQRLRSMDPYEFEHFVADLWEAQGWEAAVSQASVDQGVDIVATKQNPFPQKQVIQAKRYAANNTIGSPKIQQYSSLRQQEPGADVSVVVTTSGFSRQAEELAQNLNVKLVDAEGIYRLLKKVDRFDLVAEYSPVQIESVSGPAIGQEQQTFQGERDIERNITDAEPSSVIVDSNSEADSFLKEYTECPNCGEFVPMKRIWRKDLIFPKLQCTQCQTVFAEDDDVLIPLKNIRTERTQSASKYGYYGVAVGVVLATIGVVTPTLAILTWLALPIAISRDTRYVRANSSRNPSTGYWVWGAVALPLISAVVIGGIGIGAASLITGGAYLVQRHRNDTTESGIHQKGIRSYITQKRS